jgi:carbon monoxide dehydrogenase subunit G
MKLDGSYTLNAPRETVWPALLDPVVLTGILPGCQELELIGDNHYRASMKIRVGPVQGLFTGTVTLTDIQGPTGYHIAVEGQGAPGFMKGEGDLRLEEAGEATTLHYSGDAQVGGRLASVGQRLIETSAQALIRQSLETFDSLVVSRLAGAPAGEPIAPVHAPSEISFATGIAGKMLDDLLPPEQRRQWLVAAAVGLVALLSLRLIDEWRLNRLASRLADRLSERR